MLLNEFMTKAVEQVREEGKYEIVRLAWEKKNWNISSVEIIGMCPLSCSVYVCTGELPHIQDGVDDGKYGTVDEAIKKAIIPVLESCCTINISADSLATLVREYDRRENWTAEDLIEGIRREEQATVVEG